MGEQQRLCVALAAAMFLGNLQPAYGQCNARNKNPNHARVEKLARDYVYYLDSPQILEETKQDLIRSKEKVKNIDKWLQEDLEKELNDKIRRDPDFNRIAIRRDMINERTKLLEKTIPELENKIADQEHLRKMLDCDGFEIIDGLENGLTDFQAHVYRDKQSPGKTYVIFRGTEGTEKLMDLLVDVPGMDPWLSNFLKLSVGGAQYVTVESKLKKWAEKYSNATVGGQSLGAALAQIYIADFPESVREGVLFNAPAIRKQIVKQYKDKLGNQRIPIWIYVAAGDVVSLFGGEEHLPAEIIEISEGNVGSAANISLTEEQEKARDELSPRDFGPCQSAKYFDRVREGKGLSQHRATMLQPDSNTTCRTLSNDDYASIRKGADALSHSKSTGAIDAVLDMLTDDQLKRHREKRQADIDHEDILDKLLPGDKVEDQRVIDLIDKILAERERWRQHNAVNGAMAGNPALPKIHINRPAPWGVSK